MDNKFWKQLLATFIYMPLVICMFILVFSSGEGLFEILSYPPIAMMALVDGLYTYYPFAYLRNEVIYLLDFLTWEGAMFVFGIFTYGSLGYGFYWAFVKKSEKAEV